MNMVLKGCFSAFEDGSAEWTCTARRRDGMFVPDSYRVGKTTAGMLNFGVLFFGV
jgi:hypothetical protein